MTITNATPAVRWSIIGAIILAVVLVAIGAAEMHGRHVGRADAAIEARQDSLKYNAQQLRAATRAVDTAHRVTAAEVKKDVVALHAHAIARARVVIASDSQVIIFPKNVDSAGAVVESVGPTIEVPKEVVALVRADDAALRQDSVTMHAMAVEIQALYRTDSLHRERERLLETQLAALQPPRCGRRCGFVAGAAVAYAATHPAQIADAVKWIIRLVH